MLHFHLAAQGRSSWRPKTRKSPDRARLAFYISLAMFLLVVSAVVGGAIAFAWVAKDLPSPDKLVRRQGFATRIYDRHHQLLFDVFHRAKRTPVKWEQVPDYLKWATIAIEDKNFYSHPGFSWRGIIRAGYNIVFRHRLEGGSTLTQQLVKVVLLSPRRTLGRKIKEFILALQTEQRYSKDQILLMYLNEAPYGGNAWGVGAAAQEYFAKKVADLNLAETAILAGLPQRPSYYSPYGAHPRAYIVRARAVLRRMREDGYINKQTEEQAVAMLPKIHFASRDTSIHAPHFVFWIKQKLEKLYGPTMVEQGGLEVDTTLDWPLQQKVEKIVKDELNKVKALHITNAGVVVINPQTGEVLAMDGSKDYFAKDIDGKFNVVTQALRQPGSAIKPVTYGLALEKGYTAATLIMDVKTVFPASSPGQPDYVPVNYDGKYHGPLQLRYAFGNSINVPAVKMLALVGLKNMLAKANQMGITTLAPTKKNLQRFGLAVTLGGGEVRMIDLAGAYTAFANQGRMEKPVGILEVKDRRQRTLSRFRPTPGKTVFSKGTAFIISDILSDDKARLISFGPHSGLYIPNRKIAVKTGTTNDKRDNWAVGWTKNILVAVWVGNNDNSPMKRVASGISGATPIWRKVMLASLNSYGYQQIEKPDSVHKLGVDIVSGYPAHDGFPSRQEYFIKGTEPTEKDPVHVKLKVCRGQNKLATPSLIAAGDYDEKEFFVFKEEDPVSRDGKNRWQEGVLNWLATKKDPRYHPPNGYCHGGSAAVYFQQPNNKDSVGNNFLLKLRVDTLKPVKYLRVLANGAEVAHFTNLPYEKTIHLDDGVYQLRAEVKTSDNQGADKTIKIGVNKPWDWQPTPTPTPTPLPTLEPTASPSATTSP